MKFVLDFKGEPRQVIFQERLKNVNGFTIINFIKNNIDQIRQFKDMMTEYCWNVIFFMIYRYYINEQNIDNNTYSLIERTYRQFGEYYKEGYSLSVFEKN